MPHYRLVLAALLLAALAPRLPALERTASLQNAAQPVPAQGQTNLALNRPTTQSSIYSPEYTGSVCVDGNRTTGLCHTASEANPWWQVDLGGNYALSQVVVYNRTGTWGAREHTLRVLLSTDGQNWTTAYTNNGTDFEVLPVSAGGRTARYVRLQLAATDYLNLQEVEVYGAGTPPLNPPAVSNAGHTNLALGKPATQSSTYSFDYSAGACVDGNHASGMCHTNSEANPWWQVDLGANYALSRIVVYNRDDSWGAREHTLRVLLSADGQNWTTAWANNGSEFQIQTIDAGKRTARYVRLQLAATDYMNIQEVEVYGTP